ncbi:nicotinate phosphoribosyltransferase [Marivirga tractuosa]|uniref:Nicotinate phosphoribosyltransferase n=1 Tax=Marivirga tractuosa (strain ATCC 23168 / DSM 4126 / NBRC 15989 / NCIMB 1408 / VKM B-1430 / H-43) TaxID=643867 RepID=E4TUJ7_MARTH|nr:nicotinate phosphoribosyltransferase [Marivirga tractuosa]ADR23090.1 nicotinate phosphoribosyltransferase [Marivirga tractuosa DSM 4126]BDD16236.1 nicotinate phosphoribosyltransferase [Marivirga tractuosa]
MNFISGTYTDQYQLTMAQVYFHNDGEYQDAVFDYFFRKSPFDGGYTIFAGLENLIDILEDLSFSKQDIDYLRTQGFDQKFLQYLKDFKFTGKVYSVNEGDIVFPLRPVVRIEGNIIEAQIIETLLLNILNFQSLIATKASRIRLVAPHQSLIDFGMRRAQGLGSYHASRAAIIGGFDASSHVMAGRDFGIPVSGTMAHSFIQSYNDELTAFRAFAKSRPDDCVLLVDTYNTLKSGVPNAIKVAKEMEEEGYKLNGVRLDSGDLAYLAKRTREILDQEGLEYVKIAASNQLDEFVIKSLLEQGAPIDVMGIGTSLVTGNPDGALDGVYKLAFTKGKARIKLSENKAKVTLPGKKQVFRLRDDQQHLIGADVVTLDDENLVDEMFHPFETDKSLKFPDCQQEPLLKMVMKNGKRLNKVKSLREIQKYSKERLAELPLEFKRFDNPHIYKIGLSKKLTDLRNRLISEEKRKQ